MAPLPFIFTGTSNSNDGDVSGNHGEDDFWVVKLDSSGIIIWQESLGGSFNDWGYSVEATIDGGCIVSGTTRSNDGNVSGDHGGGDYWIVKLDVAGNIEWQKCVGGTQQDIAYSIKQTVDDGYIVGGASNSNDDDVAGNHGVQDFLMVKLNSTGNLEWQREMGGSGNDEGSSVVQTNDGAFVMTGYTSSTNDGNVSGIHSSNTPDYWVVKVGSCVANFTLYPDTLIPHHYWALNLATGVSPLTYYWSWGDGTYDSIAYPSHTYTSAGFYTICLTSHDSTGCIDSICTSYDIQKMSSAEAENTIVKIDVVDSIPSIPTNIQNTIVLQSWSVFPNPSSGNSFVNYSLSIPAIVSIALYDVLGNKLQQLVNGNQKQGEHNAGFDARKFANGVYVLQIRAGDQMAEQKIVLLR